MQSPSRTTLLVLVGLTLALHTGEEYWTFPMYMGIAGGGVPRWLLPRTVFHHAHDLHVWLVAGTVLPLIVIGWAIAKPGKVPIVAALFLESILLVNACWHLVAAGIRGGYAPGVITAVAINLPFGTYLLRRAIAEHWISARTACVLVGGAFTVHALSFDTFLAG